LGIGDVELVCKDRTHVPVTCTIAPRLTDGVVRGAAFAFAARLAVLAEPVDVAGSCTPSAPAQPG
jgi:hypothetical protein